MIRDHLLQDVRFAVRTLVRDPSFTVVAFVTLALGIAATVTVFAVLKAVLLNPLPFPDPERLVMVWERTPSGDSRNFLSAFNYARWRSRNQVFESLGAIAQIPMNITGLGDAEQVDGLAVTPEFFDALAVRPLLGRTIRRGEDTPPRSRNPVVLSYGFWQLRYGGARDVIGKMLTINGFPREIVGVMPAGFAFPAARAADLYTPMPIDPTAPPGGRNLITIARLKRGVTLESARADMVRVAALGSQDSALNTGWSASVVPLLEETVGSVRRILWFVLGAVTCLLLLACANVANLLLIRSSKRAPEMAVRVALGAGHWRLVQQLTVEGLVLTLGAASVGLGLGMMVVPAIPSLFPATFPLPRAREITIDRSIVAFALILASWIGLMFSLMPMVRVAARHLPDSLRSGIRSATHTHSRLRRVLVVLEVAIALVLVFAATLMGRSLAELYRVNPGFESQRVLTLRMLMLPGRYGPPESQISFLKGVLDEVRATPGVVSASSIHFLPLSGIGSMAPIFRSDRPEPPREQWRGSPVSVIADGYFATMGIPIVGRDFGSGDRRGAPGVAIVNESLAKQLFPNESPIGKHVRVLYSPATADLEIIGIAGNVRTGTLDRAPGPAVYIAHTQEPSLLASLVVRTQASPASAIAAVRTAIARVDPDQGVSQVQPLETVIANAVARPRVQAGVLGVFGVLALIIAAVGLYGVMAYGVEQRRREIGVQLALGAAPKMLLRAVVQEGVSLAAIGSVVGAALAWLSSGSLEGLLYETRVSDPTTFIGVGATLMIVACLATLAPALRATRVDPLIVLREE